MAEDFLLKWNDHHSLFFSGAERLLREEEFTDVSLAAESKVFRAHKFVLSICSPYFQVNITSYFTLLFIFLQRSFQGLFRRLGPDKHVIFLKDIRAAHLELLLQYMYQGEIKVQEAELVTVLNVAQSLEIKGLTDNSESKQQQGGKRRTPSPAPAPVMKKPRPVEQQHQPPPRPQQQQHLPQQQPYVQSSVSVKQEVAPVIDIDQVYFQLSW